MRSMWTRLLPLASALLLTACQSTETQTSATDAIRQDLCSRVWKGVTTSRLDVLTGQTKLEIEQDTVARAAYCGPFQ